MSAIHLDRLKKNFKNTTGQRSLKVAKKPVLQRESLSAKTMRHISIRFVHTVVLQNPHKICAFLELQLHLGLNSIDLKIDIFDIAFLNYSFKLFYASIIQDQTMRFQNRKNFANRTNGSKVANLIFWPAKMSRFVNVYGF